MVLVFCRNCLVRIIRSMLHFGAISRTTTHIHTYTRTHKHQFAPTFSLTPFLSTSPPLTHSLTLPCSVQLMTDSRNFRFYADSAEVAQIWLHKLTELKVCECACWSFGDACACVCVFCVFVFVCLCLCMVFFCKFMAQLFSCVAAVWAAASCPRTGFTDPNTLPFVQDKAQRAAKRSLPENDGLDMTLLQLVVSWVELSECKSP